MAVCLLMNFRYLNLCEYNQLLHDRKNTVASSVCLRAQRVVCLTSRPQHHLLHIMTLAFRSSYSFSSFSLVLQQSKKTKRKRNAHKAVCKRRVHWAGVCLDVQTDPTDTPSHPSINLTTRIFKKKKWQKKSSPALNSNVNLLSIFALI